MLHKFFDGFLYWANWGSPELAFRFPHGTLPIDLIDSYDLDDFVTFTQHPDYAILAIHFGEMERPDEWMEYELGSLTAMRDELMDGDRWALYIAWLAGQSMRGDYDDEEDEGEGEDENEEIGMPPVPPAFDTLTAAQQAKELRELSQDKTRATQPTGEHVTYATLLAESKAIKTQLESEQRET